MSDERTPVALSLTEGLVVMRFMIFYQKWYQTCLSLEQYPAILFIASYFEFTSSDTKDISVWIDVL